MEYVNFLKENFRECWKTLVGMDSEVLFVFGLISGLNLK